MFVAADFDVHRDERFALVERPNQFLNACIVGAGHRSRNRSQLLNEVDRLVSEGLHLGEFALDRKCVLHLLLRIFFFLRQLGQRPRFLLKHHEGANRQHGDNSHCEEGVEQVSFSVALGLGPTTRVEEVDRLTDTRRLIQNHPQQGRIPPWVAGRRAS